MAGIALGRGALKEIDTCVHCGLCLPSCPTYRVLGQEPDSPRGRIYLVKALFDGRIAPGETVLEHLDLCLGCLACQTACPSGVKYGLILEEARTHLEPARPRSWLQQALRRLLLSRVLPYPRRLAFLVKLARLAQATHLDRLVPGRLGQLAGALPRLPWRRTPSVPVPLPLAPGAPRGPRVGLLLGCIQEAVFPHTNTATARVLARHGCSVNAPAGPGCCGALHAHAGEGEAARDLARGTIDALEGFDYICTNAAGCGAHIRQFDRLLADDPAYAERAAAFSRKVRDFTELVAALRAGGHGPPLDGAHGRDQPEVLTYQDPCHLGHGQGVRRQPRQLLAAAAAPLRELNDDACCGSAGLYNLVEFDMSMQVLERKMERIRATGATTVVTANPGCLLQLRLGARRHGMRLEVIHIADYLDRALNGGGGNGH